MASKKSGSVECSIDRVGVTWRKNPLTGTPTVCVVEMRPPNSKYRLNFGSYKTEPEAMLARDYGAFLRASSGEDGKSAGGFHSGNHPSIYEFEESHDIFQGMELAKVRCDEYQRLHTLCHQQPKEESGSNSPYKEFCKAARNDITIAIGEFRRRCPHKFIKCQSAIDTRKDFSPQVDGSCEDGGLHFIPSSSNSESSMMVESKAVHGSTLEHEMSQALECYKRPCSGLMNKEIFPSSMETFNHLSSSPNGKSCLVVRGFNANQETSMWIREDSNYKFKELGSKSLLQELFRNCDEGFKTRDSKCHEGFQLQDDGVSMTDFNSSPYSSYESYNTELASFEGVVPPSCDQRMSSTSLTYSGAPGSSTSINYCGAPCSLSTGMSLEDEMGLFSDNCNNHHQEMIQMDEQNVMPDDDQLLNVFISLHEDEWLQNQTTMNTDEMLNVDIPIQSGNTIPHESDDVSEFDETLNVDIPIQSSNTIPCELDDVSEFNEMLNADIPIQSSNINPHELDNVLDSKCAPSHMLATTIPNSTSEVERVMSKIEVNLKKVVSKVASNKVMSKAEMVLDYSALSSHRQAFYATWLEAEKVKLDMVVQQNNTVKIANLQTAKNDGVISNEEYIAQVRELLNL